MRTVTMLVISAVLIVLAAGYALWLCPRLPERVPTHWNAAGRVDGWGPRNTAAFMVPGIMLLFLALILVLPLISPQRFKVEGFRGAWNTVITLLMAMFAFIQVVMLQAALHPQVDVGRVLIAGLCLFIGAIGLFMPRVKRNFWMGVRTPWTLASEQVWTATHRLAGWTIGIGGLLAAVLVLARVTPRAGLLLVIAGAIYPVFYSLWLYKKLERAGTLYE